MYQEVWLICRARILKLLHLKWGISLEIVLSTYSLEIDEDTQLNSFILYPIRILKGKQK